VKKISCLAYSIFILSWSYTFAPNAALSSTWDIFYK